jgi:EAL domain-containing protein (putative c-di-GMP-specific phosphodiesterase class I)
MAELELSAAPAPPPDADAARALRVRSARREITERRRITQRLRQALGAGGFVMAYQPIISLSSGFIAGAESHIRLTHARRGMIPAAQFMPIAERSDIIADVGNWIIQTASEDARDWPEHLRVSIALSPGHLQSGGLVRQVLEALSRSGIAPERLEFELNEAMLTDQNEDMVFSLRALHGLGVRLALTSFGTGFASLGALKRLPLTTLRLDRTLLPGAAEDRAETAILNAAIATGHALDCRLLAEGVETEAQLAQLRQFGCDEAQGPYFSQPVGAPEIRAMLVGP